MSHPVSLAGKLQRVLFPRLLAALFVVSILICGAVLYFAQEQVADRQMHHAKILQDDIQISLQDALRLLQSVADNDIIVNSFIDYEQRDTYLPLFFRTLRLTRSDAFRLALYDFAAQPIITKNWNSALPDDFVQQWQSRTLEAGSKTVEVTADGVMLAVPVRLGDSVEGALVLYVDRIEDLIYPRENTAVQIITDNDNVVLYSSDDTVVARGQSFSDSQFANWISQTLHWNTLNVHSLAPLSTVYQSLFWLLSLLLCCIIATVLISVYAVRRSASLAGETLSSLHNSIAESMYNQTPSRSVAPPDEAAELALIRDAFDELKDNLLSISLSNRQFANVIDSLEELLVVLDNNDNVLMANRPYSDSAHTLGFDHRMLSSLKNEVSESSSTIDKSYVNKYHQEVTIKWELLPFSDQNKNIIGSILIGNNVTERRKLESMNRLMSHAMQSATVAIGIAEFTESRLSIIYVNEYFTRLTGYALDDVKGKPLVTLTGQQTELQKIEIINTQIQSGESVDETIVLHKQNGSVFHTRLILTPVRYNKTVTHYVAFCQDITEQEQTRRYLIDAKAKAEESARLKSSFLASMSHEVRTPLHGVSGTLQLIDNTPLDERQQYYLSLARQSLQNLQHIVDDILDFSKIEAGQLNIERINFNLPLLIKTITAQYEPECEKKSVTLHTTTAFNDATMVCGDPVRLRQILGNLLSNAVKFTESGHIKLQFLLDKNQHQLTLTGRVTDSGIGIDKDKCESIFEVFTQEDSTTTRRFGGTGLGLAITRQLCQLLGGDIEVDSQKGTGSTFQFTIHLLPANELPAAEAIDSAAAPIDSVPQSLRILLVEDNKINQIIAKENLKNHKLMMAETGEAALAALRHVKTPFDLVLMDCQMPVMDGYEATRRIRAGEAGQTHQTVPVIALTANAMKGDKEACFEAGMTDYISKPFTAEDLARVLGRISA
ncbi:response regulator [Salinimonas sp. HHU 13199]|uniref:histidine kinase n=1 Tax=Salinimonas profundi TaxID=2729140 RepID=A0ABR8LIX5_9ALTE|nr:ATP-binding protein [Salinimonas profundi]MBD3585533.1 response regulator [Salinimonas profundi]